MSEFKTTDIVMAAYLKSNGVPLLRFDTEFNRTTFVFNAEDADEQLIQDYALGNGKVEPFIFYNTINQLKHTIKLIK